VLLASVLFTSSYIWLATDALPSAENLLVSLFLLEGWALKGLEVNTPISLGVEWLRYVAFSGNCSCFLRTLFSKRRHADPSNKLL
jgi:hypothetical protein